MHESEFSQLSAGELGVVLRNHLEEVTGMSNPMHLFERLQQLVIALLYLPFPTLHMTELGQLFVRPSELRTVTGASIQRTSSFRLLIDQQNPSKYALALQLQRTKTNNSMAANEHHPLTFLCGPSEVNRRRSVCVCMYVPVHVWVCV